MKNEAIKLADAIHTISSEEEINTLIESKAKEIGVDASLLRKHAQNAYYVKYERDEVKSAPVAVSEPDAR